MNEGGLQHLYLSDVDVHQVEKFHNGDEPIVGGSVIFGQVTDEAGHLLMFLCLGTILFKSVLSRSLDRYIRHVEVCSSWSCLRELAKLGSEFVQRFLIARLNWL